MVKRLCCLFISMLFFAAPFAFAENEEPFVRYFDNANVLEQDHPESNPFGGLIDAGMANIENVRSSQGWDFAVLTIDDFIGINTHAPLADAFYQSMGLGIGEDCSGALMIIDTNQKMFYLHLVGKCKDWITNDKLQQLENELSFNLRTEHYLLLPLQCMTFIEKERHDFLSR